MRRIEPRRCQSVSAAASFSYERFSQSNRVLQKRIFCSLPAAPVHDMAAALDNPFLRTTGMIRNTPHPVRRDFKTLANPIKLDGQRPQSKVCSALGADTDELLRAAGLTEQELSELHAAAVA